MRNAHPEFPVAKDHNDLRAKPLCCRVESCEASLKTMECNPIELHGITASRIGRILSANKQILPKKLADPPPVSSTAGSRTMHRICNLICNDDLPS